MKIFFMKHFLLCSTKLGMHRFTRCGQQLNHDLYLVLVYKYEVLISSSGHIKCLQHGVYEQL